MPPQAPSHRKEKALSKFKQFVKKQAALISFFLKDKTSAVGCSVAEREQIAIRNEWQKQILEAKLKEEIKAFLDSEEYKNAKGFKRLRYDFKYKILLDKSGQIKLPAHEIEALARTFLPDILAFFESEEGKAEFEKWKAEKGEAKALKEKIETRKEAS